MFLQLVTISTTCDAYSYELGKRLPVRLNTFVGFLVSIISFNPQLWFLIVLVGGLMVRLFGPSCVCRHRIFYTKDILLILENSQSAAKSMFRNIAKFL